MPPLQWTIDVNAVALAPSNFSYEANSAELDALKRYCEVEDLTSFKAALEVVPLDGGKFKVTGKLLADVVQSSVLDLSAVPARIEESFSIEYWPAGLVGDAAAEDLPFDEDQPEPIVGGRMMVGELLCELLLVSIDPYPRNEGDNFDWAPQRSEPEAGPFAELSRLQRQNERDDV